MKLHKAKQYTLHGSTSNKHCMSIGEREIECLQGPASQLKDRVELHHQRLGDAAAKEKLLEQLAAGSLADQLSVAAFHFRDGKYQVAESPFCFAGRMPVRSIKFANVRSFAFQPRFTCVCLIATVLW